MKLPDPKKPLQVTVSPWEVAFGQKVDADRLIQEDKEWLESRQRLMDARKRDDAKLLRSAELSRRNAPELKAAPSKLESILSDLTRGAKTALTEGIPHFVGNMSNLLQGLPEVPSEYRRSPGVFQEDLPTSWVEDAANMLLDPSNLVGGAMLKPVGRALKKTLPVVVPVVSTAYAGDTEAGGLQKMLQMMYRGRSSFTPIEERAMFMSPTPRYAEEYAKRRVGQIGGDRMVDSYLVDPFNVERRGHNITPEGGGNMQSIIAYPKAGEAEYVGSRKFAKGGLARFAARFAADSAPARRGVADVVKEKGGNWLSGSVENSLSGLKKVVRKPEYLAQIRSRTDLPEGMYESVMSQNSKANTLNTWIDKQLTKYVRNDMATPGDPIRALAERGVLHFEPDWVPEGSFSRGQAAGLTGGKSGRRMGKGRLAQDWEDLTDQGIDQMRAGEAWSPRGDVKVDNPWLSKVDSDSPVYAMPKEMEESLGFNHLIDELSNAINPDSGLPRHLQFPADRLDRVSVPQAVERVAEINAWRKALKVEEDIKRANNAATVLHKEYPDKGMKWVELKKPESLPGYRNDPKAGWVHEGQNLAVPDPTTQALADALKYEGDTMGHCVGGYCDDVLSGRSRIYSLRDAKGQPHVTIETRPARDTYPVSGEAFAMLPQETKDQYRAIVADWRTRNPDDPYVWKALAEAGIEPTPPSIVQIKGKGNAKPIDEYLPFVQDFVRSGKWSDVGDLQNSGLTKVGDRFVSDAEAAALAERHFGGKWGNKPDADENPFKYFNRINRYDEDMLSDADKAFIADWKAGNFAHGGSIQAKPVKTVQDIQAIISSLSERQFHA